MAKPVTRTEAEAARALQLGEPSRGRRSSAGARIPIAAGIRSRKQGGHDADRHSGLRDENPSCNVPGPCL